MIRAVIFDLEGVLVDSEQYQFKAWHKLAHEQGLTLDEKMAQRLIGRSRMDGMRMLLQRANRRYTEAEMLALCMRKSDLFFEAAADMSAKDLMPGAIENLEALKKRGIMIAYASSSRNGSYMIKKTGLLPYQDFYQDATDIERNKPDPELYRRVAYGLRAAFEDCLVVTDTESGVSAAKRIKMNVLALDDAMNDESADWCAVALDTINISDLLE